MLNEKFYSRMKELLGDKYEDFSAALERPGVKGVRVNNTKISTADFCAAASFGLKPLSYVENGFIPDRQSEIGQTPEHHAGMIYAQDPGAMATVSALDVQEGWWVLDTCAAPGGKSTQLADKIGDSGFILSNEYVPKRAKILVSNFERLGMRNAMVISADTRALSDMFCRAFDLVLTDAPCSGEGMLRKYTEAAEHWCEENVSLCAERQAEILNNVADLVKGGGYLLYSTCTYSIEENEQTVVSFLAEHPDFRIVPVKDELKAVTSDGIMISGAPSEIVETRRFYPHVSEGEGQYIALLKRDENIDNSQTILYKERVLPLSKQETEIVRRFITDNFSEKITPRFIKQGEYVAAVSHNCPIPAHSVFMPGVIFGEIVKNNFFPHHQMFSAYGKMMKNQLNLKKDDPRVQKYLRGEEIEASENVGSGWCAVCYEGVPIGGGKISQGRVKNHYPKGLRNK